MRYQELVTEQNQSQVLAAAVRAWSDDHGDSASARHPKARNLLQALRSQPKQYVTAHPVIYRGQAISKQQAEVLMRSGSIELALPTLTSWTAYPRVAADFAVQRIAATKWAILLAVAGSRLTTILDVPTFVKAVGRALPDDALLFDMSTEGEVIVQHNGGGLRIGLEDVVVIYEKSLADGILDHWGKHPIIEF